MTAPTPTDYSVLADELTALGEKATPDAWYVSGSGDRLMCYDERVDRGNEIGWLFNSVQSNGSVSYGAEKDNAKLIVVLRNRLPTLTAALREAARLREVEAERDRMAKALDRVEGASGNILYNMRSEATWADAPKHCRDEFIRTAEHFNQIAARALKEPGNG